MSCDHSTFRAAVGVVTFVVGSMYSLRAQDVEAAKPQPSGGRAAETDALERARKDFEAVKSARNPALQPKGDLVPRVSVPEWHGGTPQPMTVDPQSKKTKEDTKSSNWLLDGVEKQARDAKKMRPRDGRLKGDRRDRENDEVASKLGSTDDSKDRTDERAALDGEAEKARKRSAGAVNPLATYLGDWMTPRDYALLKPGLAESLGAGSEIKSPTLPGAMGAIGNPITSGDSTAGSLSAPRPGFPVSSARENPYLSTIGIGEPAPQNLAPKPNLQPAPVPSPSAASLPMTSPTISPPVNRPPPSPVPDFAKPVVDDKYFKQLKRF